MRCGCALVAIAVMLIMVGIQGVREAHAFSKPIDITCEQFMKSPPQEGWYRIKGGEINVGDSVYIVTTYHSKFSPDPTKDKDSEVDKTIDPDQPAAKDTASNTDKSAGKTADKSTFGDKPKADGKQPKKGTTDKADKSSEGDTTGDQANAKEASSEDTADDGKDITDVYIPVYSPAMWDEKKQSYPPTNLVIKTSDPGVIATANQLKRVNKMKPDEMKKWFVANMGKLVLHKDIMGMVQAGINADTKTRDLLAKDQDYLASGYLIVEEGRKPSLTGGLGALFGGFLMGGVSILYWASYLFRWKRRLT